jgi:hypothetical protein
MLMIPFSKREKVVYRLISNLEFTAPWSFRTSAHALMADGFGLKPFHCRFVLLLERARVYKISGRQSTLSF